MDRFWMSPTASTLHMREMSTTAVKSLVKGVREASSGHGKTAWRTSTFRELSAARRCPSTRVVRSRARGGTVLRTTGTYDNHDATVVHRCLCVWHPDGHAVIDRRRVLPGSVSLDVVRLFPIGDRRGRNARQ